jgi:hypothetical protein
MRGLRLKLTLLKISFEEKYTKKWAFLWKIYRGNRACSEQGVSFSSINAIIFLLGIITTFLSLLCISGASISVVCRLYILKSIFDTCLLITFDQSKFSMSPCPGSGICSSRYFNQGMAHGKWWSLNTTHSSFHNYLMTHSFRIFVKIYK